MRPPDSLRLLPQMPCLWGKAVPRRRAAIWPASPFRIGIGIGLASACCSSFAMGCHGSKEQRADTTSGIKKKQRADTTAGIQVGTPERPQARQARTGLSRPAHGGRGQRLALDRSDRSALSRPGEQVWRPPVRSRAKWSSIFFMKRNIFANLVPYRLPPGSHFAYYSAFSGGSHYTRDKGTRVRT